MVGDNAEGRRDSTICIRHRRSLAWLRADKITKDKKWSQMYHDKCFLELGLYKSIHKERWIHLVTPTHLRVQFSDCVSYNGVSDDIFDTGSQEVWTIRVHVHGSLSLRPHLRTHTHTHTHTHARTHSHTHTHTPKKAKEDTGTPCKLNLFERPQSKFSARALWETLPQFKSNIIN